MKIKKKQRMVMLPVRMPSELKTKLIGLAITNEVSVSELVRFILEEKLTKIK